MSDIGAFCEVYGTTINNRILEYLLENQDLDIAIGDMAKELKISKPKAYEVIKEFEKKDYIKKSRIIGKTQLYKLNKQNNKVKLFLKNFNECLKLVIEEYPENPATEIKAKREVDGKAIFARVYIGGMNVKEKMFETF